MKRLLAAVAVLLLPICTPPADAQGIVTNGVVTGYSRKDGVVTLVPEGTNRTLVFTNLHRARVQRGSGQPATLDDVREGMNITIHYAAYGKGWVISKVLIPDAKPVRYPAMPPSGFTTAERRGTTSQAANDGDITTQPGSKARLDRDITTQPGRTPPDNTDITKRRDNR